MQEREALYRRALGLPARPMSWREQAHTYAIAQRQYQDAQRWLRDARFKLGYRIGGFKSASREPR